MPEGRAERLICLGALVALGFLVVMTVPKWQEYSRSQNDRGAPAGEERSPEVTPQSQREAAAAAAPPDERVLQSSSGPTLRLTAEGGDCWLVVRRGDGGGRSLFTGMLARGRSVSVPGTVFWIRMGAGQNLSGLFAGRKVAGLPDGAATVVVEDGTVSVVEHG
jgi:Domain of unknown function (DUF4115)